MFVYPYLYLAKEISTPHIPPPKVHLSGEASIS